MARGGKPPAALIGLAAIAAFLFSKDSRAQSAQFEPAPEDDDPFLMPDVPAVDDPLPWFDPLSFYGDFGFDPATNFESPVMPERSSYLDAFLRMIRFAEHDDSQAESGEAYFVFFGGSRFQNTNDPPVINGEKKGVRLKDAQCVAAGFKPGCVSTAAGAYQLIKPTWLRVRKAGAWGPYLPDFSPASQDEAARRLLIEAGALPLIESGNIEAAISKVSSLWASLPGNNYKQGGITMPQAFAYFNDGLSRMG